MSDVWINGFIAATRWLRRNPRFAAMAIVTMALGIGATTTIYSVVKAVLLNSLPYRDPASLVFVSEATPEATDNPEMDYTAVRALANRARSIDSLASYADGVNDLVESGEPEVVRSLRVSRNFFSTLGVPMLLGRTFADDEHQPGSTRAVILSYGFWVRRFGADRSVVGRTLRLDDEHPQVVGVLPPSFQPLIKGTSELNPEVYTPLTFIADASCHRCQAARSIARIRSGVSLDEARADIRSSLSDIVRADAANHHPQASALVVGLRERLFGRMQVALWTCFVAVAILLLIACTNVANLSLAKALSREHEMSVRAAMGATSKTVAAQLVIESVIVAVIGGMFGVVLAVYGTRALASVVPPEVPRAGDIRVDAVVVLVAFVVSVLCGLLFGLAPALWLFRSDLNLALRGSGKMTPTPVRRRLLDFLVVAEIAAAFVLVVAASLTAKSYENLTSVDPGYNPRNVLTMSTRLWGRSYRDPARALQYYSDIVEQIRSVPGVKAVAVTSAIPMDSAPLVQFHIAGAPTVDEASAPLAQRYSVSPSYFSVMQIPMMRGRVFEAMDTPASPRVAVVNTMLARGMFGRVDEAIGRRIKLGELNGLGPWMTIVGVVGDVHQDGLDKAVGPQVYLAEPQQLQNRFYRVLVKTDGEPARYEKAVTAAILSVDRSSPIFHVKTLDGYLAGTFAQRTFAVAVLFLFALLATILSIVGIYGLVSYAAGLRSREFGIRVAIGALPENIVRTVLRHAATLAVLGNAIGAVSALAMTSLIRTLLFGVTSYDPVTYVAIAVITTVSAILTGLAPAIRAARISPIAVLASE